MVPTLIRNTGWTFQQCWDQPAGACFELLEDLAENPPDYLILAAAHSKPRARKRAQAPATAQQDVQAAADVARDLAPFLGPARPMPQHIRDLIAWDQATNRTSRR